MKKITLTGLLTIFCVILLAQPSAFTWEGRHNGFDYISDAKDQEIQGPCGTFAAVATVEAITQAYFNKTQNLDLSEANIVPCYMGCADASATAAEALDYFMSTGVVNESCFEYSENPCNLNCNDICTNPTYKITIPNYASLSISNETQLKRHIIDKGPIIVVLNDYPYTCGGVTETRNHTVLIVGWTTTGSSTTVWRIKDSWPDCSGIYGKVFSPFNYSPTFYYVMPVSGSTAIGCTGSGCSAITTRSYYDHDQDGFYNWGIGDRPNGCSGPGKMDFDDDDNSIICLNTSYTPQSTPTISGADFVCQTGTSRTFTLNNLPEGFSATWSVTPTAYFNSPLTGSGVSATINPKSDVGKQCSITYTITDGVGTASYSKSFVINGPREDQVSVTVEDANGNTPYYVSGIWLLCPNTTYYLYVNNSSGCSTTGYNWTLPSGWSKYSQYGNTVAINTNSSPSGTVYIYATTCCGYFKIKTQYFSTGGNCSKSTSGTSLENAANSPIDKLNAETPNNASILKAYPNPTSNEVTIGINDESDIDSEGLLIEVFDSNSRTIFSSIKMAKEIIIQTSDWQEGIYYVRVKYNGKYYYANLSIIHTK